MASLHAKIVGTGRQRPAGCVSHRIDKPIFPRRQQLLWRDTNDTLRDLLASRPQARIIALANLQRELIAMIRLVTLTAAVALIATPALAAGPCKDAKGRFTKCPPAAAAAGGGVVKDAKGKCRVASGAKKGQFTKCP